MRRAPQFWWRPEQTMLARALKPLGAAYGAVAARRLDGAGERAAVPVICIGNLVVGGAGKTPTAIAVAELLAAAGKKPVFVSRGYGGREYGPVEVGPARHTAEDVGDEALILARHQPAIVARDRVTGAGAAAALGAGTIVLDDGFQNPLLAKSLSFLVVDAEVGTGNGLCIPAGPLRAPLEAQLARAHGLIVVGEGAPGDALALFAEHRGLPVHRAWLSPDAQAGAMLMGRRVLAFAGIGRPRKFAESLRETGAEVVRLAEFPDHHDFSEAEARALLEEAKRGELLLATTEKDHARLTRRGGAALSELAMGAAVLPVRLVFDHAAAVRTQVLKVFG